MNKKKDMKNSVYARITGISLLLMAIVAMFSFGFVYSSILVAENALATGNNVKQQSDLFLNGLLGWVMVAVLDVIVSIGLYKSFKGIQLKLSAVAAAIRIVYTAFLVIAIWQQGLAYVNRVTYSEHELYNYLVAFESIWTQGLIIFGFHLLLLAAIAFKADIISSVYGWLLAVAGIGYVLLSSLKALLGNIEWLSTLEMILATPMAVGELALAIWLIVKAKKFD
ncbi:MAG: DUF4386 domain-containing protein [Bacteroidia bacterium]